METGLNCPTAPLGAEEQETPARKDWERNHTKIRKVMLEGLAGDGMPSNSEIAEKTGLSLTTVKAHIASLKAEGAARFDRFRMLTEEVLMGMYRAGKKGDARSGKLWLQFVEEWEERKRITNVGQNPYKAQTDEALRKALAERLAAMKGGAPGPRP